jgi:hypothetical protein
LIITTIEDYATEGCSEGDIDADRAADITNTYAIEFLNQIFRGGAAIDADVVAPPDDVTFDAR